jgi:predicted dehydrogenase
MKSDRSPSLTRRRLLRQAGAGLALTALTPRSTRGADPERALRAGVIGMDNYQAVAFTQVMNDPKAAGDFADVEVVAAYPHRVSPDIAESRESLPKWVAQIQPYGVKIVDSLDAVLKQVDVVMIMSLDGRNHLELARPVIRARKPVFIGRPLAASLQDALEIYRLGAEQKVPVFSCSQHRFSPGFYDMRHHEEVGDVLGCDVHGGCPLDPTHPDLYWHGIHGVETLFTIMGPGCVSVTRVQTDVAEFVTGTWKDGRVGSYRGIHRGAVAYQALVYGSKGIVPSGKYGGYAPVRGVVPEGKYAGYEPLALQIARFWKTRQSPVSPDETLEIFAFMEAAHESKRQGGSPVTLESVLNAARKAKRA